MIELLKLRDPVLLLLKNEQPRCNEWGIKPRACHFEQSEKSF
jgi:hypothetical protein